MRVLLVGINFWPEPAGIGPYARAYADALQVAGHDVTVVTGMPHYPHWRLYPIGDEDYPYSVIRCRHSVPRAGSSLGRVRYEITFALSVHRALSVLGRHDVVVAIVPTLASAFVASRWALNHGAAFLVVVQDIVTAAAESTGRAGAVFGLAGRVLELSVFRDAAGVAAINSGMAPALVRRGAQAERISITPNWPLRNAPAIDPTAARAQAGYATGQLICLHAGNMGAKQGLEVIVEAARLAQARRYDVRFVLIGDGNQRSILERKSEGLTHIEFRPVQSPVDYDAALAGADVLLLTQRASIRDAALPSKLTSYLGAAKPVVASVSPDSITATEVTRTGAAIVVPPGDAASLLAAVVELRSNGQMRARLARHAKTYYDTELNPSVLRERFVEFVERGGARRPLVPGL